MDQSISAEAVRRYLQDRDWVSFRKIMLLYTGNENLEEEGGIRSAFDDLIRQSLCAPADSLHHTFRSYKKEIKY